MKSKKLISGLLVMTSVFTLASCEGKNSETDKQEVLKVVEKYNKGEVTLPNTSSYGIEVEGALSGKKLSNEIALSMVSKTQVSATNFYSLNSASGKIKLNSIESNISAKAEVEVSDKLYLGAKIEGLPATLSFMLSAIGIPTSLKGSVKDVTVESMLKKLKLPSLSAGEKIPALNLSEEDLAKIKEELERSTNELTYKATVTNETIKLDFGYTGKGLNALIEKETKTEEGETSKTTIAVSEESKANFSIVLNATTYLPQSFSVDVDIPTYTQTTVNGTVEEKNEITSLKASLTGKVLFDVTVGTIQDKGTDYDTDLSEKILSIIEKIKNFNK